MGNIIISIPDLTELNADEITGGKTMLIVGDNKDCVTNILNMYENFPCALMMGDNPDQYSDHIPPVFIYEQYDSKTLLNLLTRQQRLVDNQQNSEFLLIIDNYTQDIHNNFKKNLRYLPACDVTTILKCTELIKMVDIDLIEIDFIIIMSINDIDVAYELLGNKYFKTIDEFRETCDHYITNNQVLVIYNAGKADRKHEDYMFYYKFDNEDPIKIGPDQIWKLPIQITKEV